MKKNKEGVETNTPAEEVILNKLDEVSGALEDLKGNGRAITGSLLELKKSMDDIRELKEKGPQVIPLSTAKQEIGDQFTELINGNEGKLLVSSKTSLREQDQEMLTRVGKKLDALSEHEKNKRALINITLSNKSLSIAFLIVFVLMTAGSGYMIYRKNQRISELENSPEAVASRAFSAAETLGDKDPGAVYSAVIRQIRRGDAESAEKRVEELMAEADAVWLARYRNIIRSMLGVNDCQLLSHEEEYQNGNQLCFVRFKQADDSDIRVIFVDADKQCWMTNDARVVSLEKAVKYSEEDIWEKLN